MERESDRVLLYQIPEHSEDIRLDVFLCSCPITLSRSRIKALIKSGDVKVNNFPSKPSHKLKSGDRVLLSLPAPTTQTLEPEAVEFGIIHEDECVVVVNKPAGLVVHPAPGHGTGTLVHGLLRHCGRLSGLGGPTRPGVVHRLDKDTSGLMVVAKTDGAHEFLAGQFKGGMVDKDYLALAHGMFKREEGAIELPISRHPKKRKKMSVAMSKGRYALTLWHKIEEFQSGFTLLSVSIKTGRTHQIRVHLSHEGHPIAGDPVYGYGKRWWKRHPLYKKHVLPSINRQMLHATRLRFIHPEQKEYVEFKAPLPDDMDRAVRILRSLNYLFRFECRHVFRCVHEPWDLDPIGRLHMDPRYQSGGSSIRASV